MNNGVPMHRASPEADMVIKLVPHSALQKLASGVGGLEEVHTIAARIVMLESFLRADFGNGDVTESDKLGIFSDAVEIVQGLIDRFSAGQDGAVSQTEVARIAEALLLCDWIQDRKTDKEISVAILAITDNRGEYEPRADSNF